MTEHTIEARADGRTAYVLYNDDEPRLNIALRDLAAHLGGIESRSGLLLARKRRARSFEFLFRSRVRCARFVQTIDGNVITKAKAA